jgi:hypothetical protein
MQGQQSDAGQQQLHQHHEESLCFWKGIDNMKAGKIPCDWDYDCHCPCDLLSVFPVINSSATREFRGPLTTQPWFIKLKRYYLF